MTVCPLCGANNPPAGGCDCATTAIAKPANYESPELTAGTILQGRYEILHMLGQGGMGTVYMARDLRLTGRSCVVKKLRDDYFREEDRQKAQEFFQREMEVLAGLDTDCPNIVRVQDFFAESGCFFLVMDYVQGSNLHQMLHGERDGEPFSEDSVVKWAQQICDVLIFLHNQNPPIIYRDLKPSNVMIDVKGSVKLVDFGIARRAEGGENTHVVSPGYSPPEQYWGSADVRSDIYALGATMFFLLTGKDPEALHVGSPRTVNADVSEGLDRIVQKCMSQDVNERYQSAQELWEALLHKDMETAPQSPRSRVREAITGVIILAVAGFIFYFQLPSANNTESAPTNSREVSSNILPREDNVPPEVRKTSKSAKNAQSGTNSQAADMAVQMMDEPDLTDPAGLPGHTNLSDNSPKKETENKSGGLFDLFGNK